MYLWLITTDGHTVTDSKKERLLSQPTLTTVMASLDEDYISFGLASNDDIPPAGNTVFIVNN